MPIVSPLTILTTILGPVFLLIAIGALLQRNYKLDIKGLAILQVRVLVPAFLLVRLAETPLSWYTLGKVALCIALIKCTMSLILVLVGKRLGISRSTLLVVGITTSIFNAGNFGIPIAERTFGAAGTAVEAVVVVMSNISLWGVGYALTMDTNASSKQWIREYFRLPMPYALLIAVVIKSFHLTVPEPIWKPITWCADAVVPLALMTLGMQLAQQARWPSLRFILPILFGKLILMPLVAVGLCCLLGYWPWPAAQIILASASPSAVNAVLLSIDRNMDVERTTDAVFWTTICSAITVPMVIYALLVFGNGHLPH